MQIILLTIALLILSSCNHKNTAVPGANMVEAKPDTTRDTIVHPSPAALIFSPALQHINTGTTTPEQLLAFAKTLIGTAYSFASADPAVGFDCSGFLTYTFNHFHIAVPRSSVNFTNIEKKVALSAAKPGDLVLFTGTDSTSRVAGHIGIITSCENGEYYFIHSTSGKAMGVTISALSKYYAFRFLKAIRIFPQNGL